MEFLVPTHEPFGYMEGYPVVHVNRAIYEVYTMAVIIELSGQSAVGGFTLADLSSASLWFYVCHSGEVVDFRSFSSSVVPVLGASKPLSWSICSITSLDRVISPSVSPFPFLPFPFSPCQPSILAAVLQVFW